MNERSPKRWQLLNLRHVSDSPKVEPTIGSGRLVYPGTRHIFSGEPESAKTLAAYAIALEEVRAGNLVILADFEMGEGMAKERLRELGFTDGDFDQLGYIEPTTVPTSDELHELVYEFERDFVGSKVTLAIFDASVGGYDLAQIDDGKRGDAEKFARLFVHPFWNQGIATIVIDHVTKAKDSRGRYTIGSERKLGGADVHLGFEVIRKLHRGSSGLMRIVNHKDRRGFLPHPTVADLHLTSDPDTHAITWEFRQPAQPASTDEGFRPTVLMERLSRQLEMHPAGLTRTKLYKATSGRREWLVVGLDRLVSEGFVDDTGSLLVPKRPFREVDDGSPVPKPFPAVPESPPPSGSLVPPAYGGDGNGGNANEDIDYDELDRLFREHADIAEGRQ